MRCGFINRLTAVAGYDALNLPPCLLYRLSG
jgi:hypothetical protein